MILTFAGELESGKDTVASFLHKKFGFEPVAIADNLKKACMKVFDLNYHQCYDTRGKESDLSNSIFFNDQHVTDFIHWVEKINKWELEHDQILSMRSLGREDHIFRTPRQALQFVGTEIFRDCIRPTFNIEVLYKHIYDNIDQDFVVTDGRFADEREYLKERLGALNILIKNPNPSGKKKDMHRSENDLGDEGDYDYVFINDKSKGLEYCEEEVDKMHKYLMETHNAKSNFEF